MKTHRINFLLFLLALFFTGCGVYSFTGASIPPEANTISISYFPNNADIIEPTLSQDFTTALRDKFVSQTNLDLVPKNGDLRVSGEIREYKVTPVAITGDQTAALNRLTISVNVVYVNTFEEEKSFESGFSRYEDYESSEDLATVKTNLIAQINEMLVDDIFNKAVVNW
ncbi:MAG: hypothetical protein K9G67_08825 [Bacteroidales bacterium]|nr:hypothetical protein [Bacteroidales bacterium]MCF8352583.1 hypothetical protein [Bacteroidales bacterium]MCF8376444.1 hypothetical protein [Bacteroidales bacterium]MCF8400563.1 hypothetical protein [Bacteroidales bacterium]